MLVSFMICVYSNWYVELFCNISAGGNYFADFSVMSLLECVASYAIVKNFHLVCG